MEGQMRRRLFISGLSAVALGRAIDLSACGDKFLRVGRSGRFPRYAAVHPAAILIYTPVNSTRAGIDALKTLLKRAGHNAVALDRASSVSAALAASPYDVVIADYLDADRLKGDLQSAASHAALLPILNKPSKAVETEAMRQYAFAIKPHAMTKYDALAEIDRLMESKTRGAAASK
jgi:DNA-binding NtrC family response regulator